MKLRLISLQYFMLPQTFSPDPEFPLLLSGGGDISTPGCFPSGQEQVGHLRPLNVS